MSDSLWPPKLQHARLPCPLPSPRVCANSCPLTPWCHPTISSSPVSSCSQSSPVQSTLDHKINGCHQPFLPIVQSRQQITLSQSTFLCRLHRQGQHWAHHLTFCTALEMNTHTHLPQMGKPLPSSVFQVFTEHRLCQECTYHVPSTSWMLMSSDQQPFWKGSESKMLGFLGHMDSFTTT